MRTLTFGTLIAATFGAAWLGCTPTPALEAGQSWQFDATAGTFVAPQNASALTDLLVNGIPATLTVSRTDETSFDLLLSGSQAVPQDYCFSTGEMNGIALADDGTFSWGPTDFTLPNGTIQKDLTLTGSFNDDFTEMSDVTLKGTLVVDSIPADFFSGNIDLCAVLGNMNITCTDCGAEQCLDIEVTDLSAAPNTDITLELVPEVDCHAECAASADNAECALQ